MNEKDQQLLSAYTDGELSNDQACEFERRLKEDVQLQQLLEQYQSVNTLVGRCFDSIMHEPLPESISNVLCSKPVACVKKAEDISQSRARRRLKFAPLQIAASLVLAIVIGSFVINEHFNTSGGTHSVLAGLGVSEKLLSESLESTPSQHEVLLQGPKGVTFSPLSSYLTQNKQYCREFSLAAEQAMYHGVSCREGKGWQTKKIVAVRSANEQSDGYVTASGDSGMGLDYYIDNHIHGIPFGREEEQQLIDRQWQ